MGERVDCIRRVDRGFGVGLGVTAICAYKFRRSQALRLRNNVRKREREKQHKLCWGTRRTGRVLGSHPHPCLYSCPICTVCQAGLPDRLNFERMRSCSVLAPNVPPPLFFLLFFARVHGDTIWRGTCFPYSDMPILQWPPISRSRNKTDLAFMSNTIKEMLHKTDCSWWKKKYVFGICIN